MRSFRSNRENLRDTRIVYTFLICVALVCVLLGILVGVFSDRLHKRELEGYYESLTLCADALSEWNNSDTAEDRYKASLRFEQAVSGLPSEVSLASLMQLVNYMRMGSAGTERVRMYTETFALLSSIEYKDTFDARKIIGQTLASVTQMIDGTDTEESTDLPPEDILEYTRRTAERAKSELLDGALSQLELKLSEARGTWIAQNENVRVEYSITDGNLESFTFLRVGDSPKNICSGDELCEAALSFYRLARRDSAGAHADIINQICGFTLCRIDDGSERWNVCIDTHGRVWSIFRSGQ